MERYIGLISGTSADGIDAALVEFEDPGTPRLVRARSFPYPATLHRRIEALITGARGSLEALLDADAAAGRAFGDAACALLADSADGHRPDAIGCHGQTVFHRPGPAGLSLQIGDPNRVADMTRLPVVADFRRADIAAGGEGAPLAPLFHAEVFAAPGQDVAVVNLGGIANLTLLRADGTVLGFDTGPANTLLDGWAARQGLGARDEDGVFAAAGTVDTGLLDALLADNYFTRPPPKSTGREHFNMAWLDASLAGREMQAADVQATLVELTAASVAGALRAAGGDPVRVLCCGGGVHNPVLMQRLAARLQPLPVTSTSEAGVDPDFVEAMLFAWLARERMHGRTPRHLQAVTGARAPALLGGVWLPPER